MAQRLLGGGPDVSRIVLGRSIRGFADGFVSVLLAQYLTDLGFSPVQVGAIVTGTLIGSAVLTVGFGFTSRRFALRHLLMAATGMMFLTGLLFAGLPWFWPLFVVAVIGTLNPSGGDVSVFLPVEQSFLTDLVEPARHTRLFASYNLAAIGAGAFGALASALPSAVARRTGWEITTLQRGAFLAYAAAGLITFLLYRRLQAGSVPDRVPAETPTGARTRILHTSRRTVLELAGLFSIDSAGSGFIVTSLLVLWLHLRWDLSAAQTGAVFFAAGLLGGASQFLAPHIAARLGLVRTMAFTHLPANVLLILAAFAPSGRIAVALLLLRALFAQMDVPARQAFVMAVVPPDERAAAASLTNVPRSLASAVTPLLAGALLSHSTFGWPLLIAGIIKIAYDLSLLALYRNVPEEVGAHRVRRSERG